MGIVSVDSQEGGGRSWVGLKSLVRRKQVDSAHSNSRPHQLAKELSVPYLIAIGVGSTIGAGVYILVGTVAREHSGPALTISFLVAGIAAALSAFCYAELSSRCPSAGSAYHYSYICVGEGVAWLVGWALILEYTIGGAAVARGISPNLGFLFGGENNLPAFLSRQYIPGLDIMVDPFAAVLVLVVTGLLSVGIKESTLAQAIVTTANVCALLFVIIAGAYLGFKTGWVGYGENMNSPTGSAITAGENRRRWTYRAIIQPNRGGANRCLLFLYPSWRSQWFSGGAESARSEFSGQNAYELLGVSETSSFAEIKASFRKLAKETHPDLAVSKSDSAASQQFVQILAAYEILSDSEKRAHYDSYLFSQRKLLQKQSREDVTFYVYNSHVSTYKQLEVVEWLKWYRSAIKDILSEKQVVVGTGYFDVLERDFYSAIHQAYYGPVIESIDFLPDRFEAEERSVYETPEVLHLVSGRDLFGMVCVVNKFPELSFCSKQKLNSPTSMNLGICQSGENECMSMSFNGGNENDFENSQLKNWNAEDHKLHAYIDLELHVYGRVVALATRVPPKGYSNGIEKKEDEDRIHVFLNSYECPENISKGFTKVTVSGGVVGSRIPLGTITGLGTSAEEGSCFVYNSSGTKTHVIMKHRTLMVRHMHWYGVGEEVSVCECRCSRARLPPSKYWLFEPRCGMHDVGGWYVETFGRDKKGWTVPSQRYWDGFDPSEQFEKRLHPAMYLLALAYRTLDLEDARIRKRTVVDIVERKLSRILNWCKKLV